MELPNDIGARCEAYLCGDVDFLPIKCNGCQKLFCRHHITLDSHSCSSLAAKTQTDISEIQESSTANKRERCGFGNCQKPTLESVIVDTTEPEHRVVAVCPLCSGAFCAIHRHPTDHSCTRIPPEPSPTQKNPEAHALLSKHFPASSSKPSTSQPKATKTPTDPKKLARLRAVEVMKMRHHAIPADPKDKTASVPPTQRLHIKVVVTQGTTSPTERIFWLRKTIGTGRALDLLATHFDIRISDTTHVFLEKLSLGSGESVRLRNDKLLADQVEDGESLALSMGESPS